MTRSTPSNPNHLEGGWCVMIPMFNEESNVERCLEAISKALEEVQPEGRLLIVEDGSSDSTWSKLESLRSKYPKMILIRHEKNRGYGAALRTGITHAHKHSFSYILFMDADLTTDPKYIPLFLEKMKEGYDVIKATRYSGDGGMAGVPFHRVMISRVGNMIARSLFRTPITDCTNGFRAIRVPILARLPLQENSFAVIVEELYFLTGIAETFSEIPYVLTSRGADQGVSRFIYRPKVFLQYLSYAFKSACGRPKISNLPLKKDHR